MQAEKCFNTKYLLLLALFLSPAVYAQDVQSQLVCRALKHDGYQGNTFVNQGETIIGDSVCHVETVKAATPPAAVPATPATPAQPAAAPAVSAPAPSPAQTTAAAIVPATANPPAPKPQPRADGRKRIFITDEPIDESQFIARGGGSGTEKDIASGSGNAVGFAQRGANPRTVELDALIYKSCGAVVVTNDLAKADYILLFRRDDGRRSSMFAIGGLYGLLISANSKISGAALFSTWTDDLAFATEARTVKTAIVDVCKHIE